MITIVDKGPHPDVAREVVCHNCGCTLSYVPADVRNRIDYDYYYGGKVINYINCPSCNYDIRVKVN